MECDTVSTLFISFLCMMSSVRKCSSCALLALRLAAGAIFIYHGMLKWNMEAPSTLFTILKYAEPLGGIALILGVLTQWAGLGLSIIMLGAIYMKMTGFGQAPLNFAGTFAPQGGTGWEFDLMILAGTFALFIMGAGKWSVDGMMRKSA